MLTLIARIVEASRRHALIVVALALILAGAGAAYTARHIAIDTDIEKIISPKLEWRQRATEMDREFPNNADLLAIVIDGTTPDLASDAATFLARRLGDEHDVFRSVRQPDGTPFFRHDGLLFLSVDEVQSYADGIITAQPMLGTLAADPNLRGVVSAIDLLAQGVANGAIDPAQYSAPFTAIASSSKAALAGKYAPLSWENLLSNRPPQPQELRRFVLTQPKLDYDDLEPGAKAAAAVRAAAAKAGFTPERGVRVRITGPIPLNDDQFSTLSQGAGLTTALSLGLLFLWLFLGLGSPRLVAAIFITLVVGLIACATYAVVVVGPLNPISLAFAVLFIGIAVDFGIQFSMRFRDERHRIASLPEALNRTARGIGGALGVAAIATAVGFFSFVPTDYTGVSELGLIAGAGMLIALVLNLTLLPALLTLLHPPGESHPVGFAWAAPINSWLVDRRRWVMIGTSIIAIAAAVSLHWLQFDFNPLNLENRNSEAMQTLYDLMKDPTSTPDTIEILTDSPAAAVNLQQRLDPIPEIAQTLSVNSFVPENQAAKIEILQDARMLLGPTLTPSTIKPKPNDDDIMRSILHCVADLQKAAQHGDPAVTELSLAFQGIASRGNSALPRLDENLASGIGNRLDDLRDALDPEPVTLDTLPLETKKDWIADDGRVRVEVFPKGNTRDNDVLRRFAAAVQKIAPTATGTPITIQESAFTVTHAFMTAGAIAVIAIALLLLIVLRRISDTARVLIPLLLAGLLTLSAGVLLGLPLNYANIITLPMLLGIGVAFDIYFVMRWRAGEGDLLQSSTARAILFSALSTGTAFGSLAFSKSPGMSEMGKLLTLALFFTLASTFILLPALLGPVQHRPVRRGPETDARD